MILFTVPSKPFERTAKGSVRTGLVCDMYAKEIERAYKLYDEQASGTTGADLPQEWNPEEGEFAQSRREMRWKSDDGPSLSLQLPSLSRPSLPRISNTPENSSLSTKTSSSRLVQTA